jgi:VanZ family protein
MPPLVRALYRVALVAVILVIAYLAVIPSMLPAAIVVSDKLLHGLAFFVVLFLVDFSWPDSGVTPAKLSGVFAYGVLIEVVQYFLPQRDFSLADMLADVLGMGLYVLVLPLLQQLPLLRWRWHH